MSLQNAGRPATARPVNEPQEASLLGSKNESTFPTKSVLNQAENIVIDAARQFRRAQARRRPGLAVQIGVRAGNQPYGRSRPFLLNAGALDKLLDTAARLEWSP